MSQSKFSRLAGNWHEVLWEITRQSEQVAHTVKRKRQMSVEILVQTLVLECLTNVKASLADFVQTATQLGARINKSSFDERLTERLVMLLASILQMCLESQTQVKGLANTRLKAFKAVFIVDSTQISVSQKLSQTFMGNLEKAKMKVHLVLNYLTGMMQAIECVAGRTADQKNRVLAQLISKGVLFLFDLGYFQQELLQTMTQKGAFFVTRCQSQVGLYLPQSGERIHLSEVLKAEKHATTFEADYVLGNRVKTPVRVVARRLSDQQAESRRRQAKAKAKKQGKSCSQAYLVQLGWNILVTNLNGEWTIDDLFTLYGIRWQIEITFKVWKSQLGVAQLGNWRPERVLCQFYAHLIGAFLCHSTAALVPSVTSFPKAVQVIQHHIADLLVIIRHKWRGIERWANELRLALARFAQQDKRLRTPTTLQTLMNWGLTGCV